MMASVSVSESKVEPRPCASFAELHLWKVFRINKLAWLSFPLRSALHGLFKPIISSRGDDDNENHSSPSGQKDQQNRDKEAKDSCQRQASSLVPEADLEEEGSCSQRATLTPYPEPGEDKVLQSNASPS